MFFSAVPAALLQDDLPAAYDVFEAAPGTAYVGFRMDSCKNAAVGGRDAGPTTLMMVTVAVTTETTPPNSSAGSHLFVLDLGTDSTDLLAWFNQLNVTASLITTELDWSQLPGDFLKEASGAVRTSGMPAYEWSGAAPIMTSQREERLYLYYGPDPSQDFWDTFHVFHRSDGDGPGTVQLGESSRLRQTTDLASLDARMGAREVSSLEIQAP